jgi:preprotein translocase subunit SecE
MTEQKAKRLPNGKTPVRAPAKASAEKTGFLGRVGSFFTNLPKTVAKPFQNTWRELRKVTWPTRSNFVNSTLIVLLFMVFMGVVIGLLDMGSTEIIKLLSGLAA